MTDTTIITPALFVRSGAQIISAVRRFDQLTPEQQQDLLRLVLGPGNFPTCRLQHFAATYLRRYGAQALLNEGHYSGYEPDNYFTVRGVRSRTAVRCFYRGCLTVRDASAPDTLVPRLLACRCKLPEWLAYIVAFDDERNFAHSLQGSKHSKSDRYRYDTVPPVIDPAGRCVAIRRVGSDGYCMDFYTAKRCCKVTSRADGLHVDYYSSDNVDYYSSDNVAKRASTLDKSAANIWAMLVAKGLETDPALTSNNSSEEN